MNKAVPLIIAALTLMPPSSAGHGEALAARGTVGATDISWVGKFWDGADDEQTWLFEVVAGAVAFGCRGFGSIEIGFTFGSCPQSFAIGGIDHYHPYQDIPPVDAHDVAFILNGVEGTAEQVSIF